MSRTGRRRLIPIIAATLIATVAVACGEEDPAPAAKQPAPKAVGPLSPTPQEAARRYGQMWGNWKTENILTVNERLSTLAVGKAKRQAVAGAKDPRAVRDSIRYDLENRGRVESVVVKEPRGRERKVLVVIRQAYARDGRFDRKLEDFRIVYAEVRQTPEGWGVSEWAPVL